VRSACRSTGFSTANPGSTEGVPFGLETGEHTPSEQT